MQFPFEGCGIFFRDSDFTAPLKVGFPWSACTSRAWPAIPPFYGAGKCVFPAIHTRRIHQKEFESSALSQIPFIKSRQPAPRKIGQFFRFAESLFLKKI
ncbi:MAG: hypothetical protein B6245_07080 [Desulfobacteraceae bacterium 4572_88]|nr:MAG: hypothetical protein B6245_07080 [Desulfobacteraceae bacterium 4572_88]